MPTVLFDAFPGGKRRAFTMSFDDAREEDRRLVGIFNRHGIRGTFHIASSWLGRSKFIGREEVATLYQGHEVAAHSRTHPHLPHLSDSQVLMEVLEDRRDLESLVGYPVRGFAYPGGGFDDRIVGLMAQTGLTYSRTTATSPDSFGFPTGNFHRLGFTCRHTQAGQVLDKFLAMPKRWSTQAMIVMGHSYEYTDEAGWAMIESVCAKAANNPELWYTTLIELVDYTIASQRMVTAVDGSLVYNPNAISVWATIERDIVEIKPGQTLKL